MNWQVYYIGSNFFFFFFLGVKSLKFPTMEERGANPKDGFSFANHAMWELIVHYYCFMLYSRCTSPRIPIFKLLRISTLYPFLFARSIKMVKFGPACFVILWAYYQCSSVVEQTSGAVDQHYVFYSYTLIEFSVLYKEKNIYSKNHGSVLGPFLLLFSWHWII